MQKYDHVIVEAGMFCVSKTQSYWQYIFTGTK